MKNKTIQKNLSASNHPRFVYLIDNNGDRQKHYIDSPEDWRALQDICDMMNLKIHIPSGKE